MKIQAELDRGQYPTGTKVTPQEFAAIRLQTDKFHGDWNYRILPNPKKK